MTNSTPTTPESNPDLTRENRLIVYGSLAPDRSNAHVLAHLQGTWTPATIRGTRLDDGWGGYPGVHLDDAGDIPCQLFESADLPAHWAMVDEFEGVGYRRVPVTARVGHADVEAYVYELAAD